MLIDDDPITSLLLERVNALAGFSDEVTTFYSAVDALDCLRQCDETSAPEIIFLDICMPIVSGWQFLKKFKALENKHLANTSVYMLTTSSAQSDMNRAKKFDSVVDYVVKPLTVDRLQRIQNTLDSVLA